MRFGQMQLFPSRARSIDGQQQESDRVDKDGAMSGAPPTAPAVVKQHTFEAPQLGALSGDAGYEPVPRSETSACASSCDHV
jgi:hypothetical protein